MVKDDVEKASSSDSPCHPKACAIQDCLTKNNYKEDKCQQQVDELYECCDLFYRRNGEDAKSVSCPKYSLLRLKMKQRTEAKDVEPSKDNTKRSPQSRLTS